MKEGTHSAYNYLDKPEHYPDITRTTPDIFVSNKASNTWAPFGSVQGRIKWACRN